MNSANTIFWINNIFISLVISGLMYVAYIDEKKNPDVFEYDIDMVIVSIGSECSLTQDKYRTPQMCTNILFRTIKGPELYRNINTCDNYIIGIDKINIDVPWLYNHHIGDTVHFTKLVKNKFFTITKK